MMTEPTYSHPRAPPNPPKEEEDPERPEPHPLTRPEPFSTGNVDLIGELGTRICPHQNTRHDISRHVLMATSPRSETRISFRSLGTLRGRVGVCPLAQEPLGDQHKDLPRRAGPKRRVHFSSALWCSSIFSHPREITTRAMLREAARIGERLAFVISLPPTGHTHSTAEKVTHARCNPRHDWGIFYFRSAFPNKLFANAGDRLPTLFSGYLVYELAVARWAMRSLIYSLLCCLPMGNNLSNLPLELSVGKKKSSCCPRQYKVHSDSAGSDSTSSSAITLPMPFFAVDLV